MVGALHWERRWVADETRGILRENATDEEAVGKRRERIYRHGRGKRWVRRARLYCNDKQGEPRCRVVNF